MTTILQAAWGADTSSLEERADHVFRTMGTCFPATMYWSCKPMRRIGAHAEIEATTEEAAATLGGDLFHIWRASVGRLAESDVSVRQLYVMAAVWDPATQEGARADLRARAFQLTTDEGDLATSLSTNRAIYDRLLRRLGNSTSIGGVWMRKRAAFAGDPLWLYEPKRPFSNLYDPLEWDEHLDEVRKVRVEVEKRLSRADLTELLASCGVEPDPLDDDRIFVSLGDPLGEGGMVTLKRFQKKVAANLL